MVDRLHLFPILIVLVLISSCNNFSLQEDRTFLFLKQNMGQHYWTKKQIVTDQGNALSFSPYDYETLYIARHNLDSLCSIYALFAEEYHDSCIVTDQQLQNHVKRLVSVWQKSPIAENIQYDLFCEFLLPYRAGGEKWIDYADSLIKNYPGLCTPISDDPVEIATAINQELTTRLAFDLRSHAQLYEPDILELLRLGKGSCSSLCEIAAQCIRLAGVPAAIDECPVWAHRNSGHQWNAVYNGNGLWIPFDATESDPGHFTAINDSVKAPKIYRYTFSSQKNKMPPVTNIQDIPLVFRVSNKIDVTSEYTTTSDVEVELTQEVRRSDILYLSVFNAQEWKIIDWAKIDHDKAVFHHIGNNNIIYLPVFYQKGQIIPAAAPFILTPEGKTTINISENCRESVKLKFYNVFFDLKWNIGIPLKGYSFELFYWDHAWISCGQCLAASDQSLYFDHVPTNGLYWLKSLDWDNTWQRIFTIQDTTQIWY